MKKKKKEEEGEREREREITERKKNGRRWKRVVVFSGSGGSERTERQNPDCQRSRRG